MDVTTARELVAEMSALREDAVTAALAAEGDADPDVRDRVERIAERMDRVEEALAKLMEDEVPDTPMMDTDGDNTEPDADPDDKRPVAAGISAPEREKLADDDKAMPDGSFPIRNVADLHNAIQAFGRAKDPAAARRWIRKRASELGAEDELPDSWD